MIDKRRESLGDYALRPSGLSRYASQAKPAAAIARGYTPPMKLPLKRTEKAAGDHEITNPALREWMGDKR